MPHELVANIRTDGCDVYVGRPSKWGNPFRVGVHGNRAEVMDMYYEWIWHDDREQLREDAKRELRGKVLGCHCAPQQCHAEILADIANS